MPAGLPPAPPPTTHPHPRATFDLTGLPPTPEEIDAFVKDTLPEDQAFAKVVDRLLASPHHGERMAQHWLDVVATPIRRDSRTTTTRNACGIVITLSARSTTTALQPIRARANRGDEIAEALSRTPNC